MFKIELLNELQEGQECVVTALEEQGSMRRRLMDLGIINGSKIKCVMKSPGGDPVAFYVKGALIALRSEDSSKIKIQICTDGEGHIHG